MFFFLLSAVVTLHSHLWIGIFVTTQDIVEQFQKTWLLFFCRAGREEVDVDDFAYEVEGWLPRLDEYSCMLCTVRFFLMLCNGNDLLLEALTGGVGGS